MVFKARSLARSTVLAAVLLLLMTAPLAAQHLRIYYPDIEQGSSTVVVSPTGKALLIDAASGIKAVDEGIENFLNDLIEDGIITSLDYTVATHYDEDHIGRMENVFQLVPMPPTAIAYDRGEFGSVPSTFAYGDYSFGASFFNRTTAPICTVIDLGGGVTAKVVTVNGEVCNGTTVDLTGSGQFENAASLAVLVEYGDVDIWIGGDLTGNPDFGLADVESGAAPPVGDVDVYTMNHHGSRTSSNQTFLSALKAEVGINQSSIENNFGHPNTVIVNRFLATPDTNGQAPIFIQQNPGDPADTRSDDSLADYIVDCDDAAANDVIGLPGTIVLLSDGTSYRVHGCNLPATSFPADEGIGTIGDYPPAIRRVLHTPRVPTATEGVTVEADLEDTSSAEIRYDLNGVAQTPVAMSLATGITWTGTIPAQADGAKIEYRIAATDASSQTENSPEGCYYAGTTPIATFRVVDADSVLVPKTCGVRIRGNMTAEPGVFHPTVTQAYVQDATGGVQIFDASIDPTIARGDDVEWVGELEQFGGQTEVNVAENFGNFGHFRIGAGTEPAPQVVTVAQVGETTEGTLIRLNNLTVVSGAIPESGSGSFTVTDDGGVSTLEVRIDGDTDIPGANTPSQPFDLIGLSSQFDTWVALDDGYQITPRDRADFLTDEVNFGPAVISEIHADPDGSLAGDANGDGVRSATGDEFVEILNSRTEAVDISGWTISDGSGVQFTFPANTVLPPREAAVVFGGGTPTGDFGNAAANGLVFTASGLSLNNGGDTVTLADDQGATVQTTTYGSEASDNQSIVRDPDFSNAPFVKHSTASGSGGALFSPGTRINGQSFTVPPGAVILTEVMYDPSGSDSGLEWIEIYNTTGQSINLTDMCIGSGGGDYTNSLIPLDSCIGGCTIHAGQAFVVGGPTSSADNASPIFDLALQINPGLQNSGADADGVALFNFRCSSVRSTTVPVDVVIYGDANTNGLIDENGQVGAPDVGDGSGGQSLERVDLAGTWQIQAAPNPNIAFPPPPPGGLLLSEVFYDYDGTDGGLEWVELYHSGTEAIDLADFSLGYGGTSWTSGTYQLAGTIQPGETIVVGGPSADAGNGNPTYFQVQDFSPDLQNSGTDADGVALFNVPAVGITGTTVPIDAVLYGTTNTNALIDETGNASAPEVGDAPGGQTIERTSLGGTWQIQLTPSPGTTLVTGGGNTAPTAAITAPANASTFTEGTSIGFTGTASDTEDGDLTSSLAWTSDLDGSIGSGGSFSAILSVGTHTVTAAVTDSGSLSGNDTITVTVNAAPVGVNVVLSEVFYDALGGDNGLEWVELYNAGSSSVDLSTFCLGGGGSDYTTSEKQLSGTIAAGAVFVVGGPTSNASNHNPTFDLAANFSPDLQNSGSTADGIALFDVPCSSVGSSTVPVDAVVYGGTNTSGLIDESGFANAPEVGDAPSGQSIERTDLAGSWQIQATPTPNTSPLGGS